MFLHVQIIDSNIIANNKYMSASISKEIESCPLTDAELNIIFDSAEKQEGI